MSTTITLPQSSADLLVRRAVTAAARARANGLPMPTVKITDRWVEDVKVYDALARIRGLDSDYRSMSCRMATVSIEKHEPPVGEWVFVGHRELSSSIQDGRRTHFVSNFGRVPDHSHGSGLCCDHCGHRRQRKLSFILEKKSDGRLVEVGTDCVESFTGSSLSSGFLEGLRDHRRIMSSLETDALGGGEISQLDLVDESRTIVAVACSVLSRSPYITSSQAASEGTEATWMTVFDELSRYRREGVATEEIRVTLEDFLKAEEVERFYGSDDREATDFVSSVRSIMKDGISQRRDISVLVAAAAFHERSLTRVARRTELNRVAAISTHLGEPKDRIEFIGRVFFIHGYSSKFGDGSMIFMTDDAGHLMTWMTSSPHGLEAGHQYLMKGTVASHGTRRHDGILAEETRVGRIKVMRDMGPFETLSDIEAEMERAEVATAELDDVFGPSFSF